MKKNILDNIEPFNKFWFKSCFYHALLSGLGHFGIKAYNVLFSELPVFERDFKIKPSIKKLNYELKKINIEGLDTVKRAIDEGHPVIIGLDCFYLKTRLETFFKEHLSHFLLVYGYDLEKYIFNVIEHNYANSYRFEKKELDINNVFEANTGFKLYYAKSKYDSYKIVSEYGDDKDVYGELIKSKPFSESFINNIYNMNMLKEHYLKDKKALSEHYDIILNYVIECKNSRQILLEAIKLKNNDDPIVIEKLISEYTLILTILRKARYLNDLSVIEDKRAKLADKIDSIVNNEESLCKYLFG
jgi:hypothetical protein